MHKWINKVDVSSNFRAIDLLFTLCNLFLCPSPFCVTLPEFEPAPDRVIRHSSRLKSYSKRHLPQLGEDQRILNVCKDGRNTCIEHKKHLWDFKDRETYVHENIQSSFGYGALYDLRMNIILQRLTSEVFVLRLSTANVWLKNTLTLKASIWISSRWVQRELSVWSLMALMIPF